MKHVVFVDSTVTGLLALEASKRLGHFTTFIIPKDASFLSISVNGDHSRFAASLDHVDRYIEVDSLDGDAFSTVLDALNAEQQLYSTRRDLAQARYDYLMAWTKLHYYAGNLRDTDLAKVDEAFGPMK